ncbi:Tfp pilus assembly protein FimT/FimU, partial [Thermodesulfobacteriota bacterium]
ILMSIAIPSILSQRPIWRTNGSARVLLTNLRLAQSKAIRSGSPHSIIFLPVSKSYIMFEDNGVGALAGNGKQDAGEETVKTVTLNTLVTFGRIGTPPALKGGAITNGISFPSNGTNGAVTFLPDGSAEDGTAYLYPEEASTNAGWQRAVEVIGNTGRVKIFAYDTNSSTWL